MIDWEGETLIGYPLMIEGTTYGNVSDEKGLSTNVVKKSGAIMGLPD